MTLSDYKKEYLREKTTESIEALFKELKQAKVWVPFNPSLMDENDGQEGARLKPDILQREMTTFILASQKLKTSPKTIMIAFSWLQLSLTDCLFAAEGIESFPVRGIVLDAFSDPVEIDQGAFEAIRQS